MRSCQKHSESQWNASRELQLIVHRTKNVGIPLRWLNRKSTLKGFTFGRSLLRARIDVLYLNEDGRRNVRMNRHGYFEVLYLCAGSADCHIQDRLLPFQEGDLAIIGSTVYHRVECRAPLTIAALFFEPNLSRCDGSSDSTEYLTPFLLQDFEFPHIVPAASGVAHQVLDLKLRIRSEVPATSPTASLALRTYLKNGADALS